MIRLLSLRDDKEEARIGNLDHRLNHWTAVRDALMGTHADIFPQVARNRKSAAESDRSNEALRTHADHSHPDQGRAAGQATCSTIEFPTRRIMGYLRNNSIFAFGQADRARTSATFREILDAMWLFNAKFEQARFKFDEIKAQVETAATKATRTLNSFCVRLNRTCSLFPVTS